MEHVLIGLAALVASSLTFFSGFGLGTLLLPVFALFFPVPMAVALTAVVHFLNNAFKFFLVGKHVVFTVAIRFGLTAMVGAYVGAMSLFRLEDLEPAFEYTLWSQAFHVMPDKAVIGLLMILFAAVELSPSSRTRSLSVMPLALAGLLSGFLGGLSGHQGALRSAFLVRMLPSKEQFIGTGVVIACLIDVSRLFVYGRELAFADLQNNVTLLLVATLGGFAGACLGNRLLPHVPMRLIQRLVGFLLMLIAIGLVSGSL